MFSGRHRDLMRMLVGLALMCIVMYGVFALLGYWQWQTALGSLLGFAMTFGNFYLLYRSVDKVLSMDDENEAKVHQLGNYWARIIMIAVVVVFALRSKAVNGYATIIPLVFPRLLIYVFQFIDGRREALEASSQDTEHVADSIEELDR